MADSANREARTYRIPPIEIYEVTDEQLELIEESCRNIGQDLSFCISSLSIGASFAIALSSANPAGHVKTLYYVVVAVSFFVSLYTGIRWFRVSRRAPTVIQKIRSRRMKPQDPT